ncbi:MAG: hypothetical protein HXS53_01320 [Theionarchaea archaeon]|nr:hypothetical protein [Theionarchaea archaeon]
MAFRIAISMIADINHYGFQKKSIFQFYREVSPATLTSGIIVYVFRMGHHFHPSTRWISFLTPPNSPWRAVSLLLHLLSLIKQVLARREVSKNRVITIPFP